jgi:hypothetical protein
MVYVAGLEYHKGEHISIHGDCYSPWRYSATQFSLLAHKKPPKLGSPVHLYPFESLVSSSRSNLHVLTIRLKAPTYWSAQSLETTQTHTTLEALQRPLHNLLAGTAQGKPASCPFVT